MQMMQDETFDGKREAKTVSGKVVAGNSELHRYQNFYIKRCEKIIY